MKTSKHDSYKTIHETDLTELDRKVNKRMRANWKVRGDLVVSSYVGSNGTTYIHYYQTMVLG